MKRFVAPLLALAVASSTLSVGAAPARPNKTGAVKAATTTSAEKDASGFPVWADCKLQFSDLVHVYEQIVQESALRQDEVNVLRSARHGFLKEAARYGKDDPAMLRIDLRSPEGRAQALSEMRRIAESISPAQRPQVFRVAIAQMIHDLNEPGSKLHAPGEYRKSLEELGYSLGGIGVFVDETPDESGLFKVIQVMQGFPSERQGVRAGDRILSVNGISARGVSLSKLASTIRGEVGTPVEFETLRDGKPQKYRLQREWLRPNPQGALAQLAAPGIGWIRVHYLGLRCDADVQKLWKQLAGQGAQKLILDLRNCPGELHGVPPMAALFLPTGSPVYSLETRLRQEKFTTISPPQVSAPLVVLVNEYTGEAAATLAGSLRDSGRAIIIGRPTRPNESKAYRWVAHELSDGSTVSLVTEWVRLPGGQDLAHTALQPDLDVEARDPAAEVTGLSDDSAYQRAVKYLKD